jgi:hypothetical protein
MSTTLMLELMFAWKVIARNAHAAHVYFCCGAMSLAIHLASHSKFGRQLKVGDPVA